MKNYQIINDKNLVDFPILVFSKVIRIPFLLTFNYVLEDRRPDLDGNDEKIKDLGYRYKHQLYLKIPFFKFSVVLKSINRGFIAINDKEVEL